MEDENKFEFIAPQFQDFKVPPCEADGADNFFIEDSAKNELPKSDPISSDISIKKEVVLEEEIVKEPCTSSDVSDNKGKAIKSELESDLDTTCDTTATTFSIKKFAQTPLETGLEQDNVPSANFHGLCATKKHHSTKVEPFSFDERQKRLIKNKEMKIKQILEEEKKMREFHANPVPKHILQPKATEGNMTKTVQCTKPKPPKFLTEERIKNKEKRDAEEDKSQFKARPALVLKKPAFVPKPSEIPPVDPLNIQLNTEKRAKERDVFELTVKEKEAKIEIIREQRKREAQMEEQEEIKRLRKAAVIKANPVPDFKKVPTHVKGLLPLTLPKSPSFMSRARQNK